MADPPKKPPEGHPPVPIFRRTGRPYAPPSQLPTSLGPRPPRDEMPGRTGELLMAEDGTYKDTMAPPSADGQATRHDLEPITVEDELPPSVSPPLDAASIEGSTLAGTKTSHDTGSLLGRPVTIPRAHPRDPPPSAGGDIVTQFFGEGSSPSVDTPPMGRTTVDDPDDLPVKQRSIGGLGRIASWIPQRKQPPKPVNDNRTDDEVDADLKAKTARDRLLSRVWIAAVLLAFAGLVYWGLFTNPFGKKSTLPSAEAPVASMIKTPAPPATAPSQQASAPAAPAAAPQPATPAPATAPVQQAPVAVATPPSVQPTATPPPVEQAPVPAPRARAIRSLADKTPPKPTPPPATISVPKEEKVTVSSTPAKERPKPAKAEVKAASKKVAVASASSILAVATLSMCEGMQVQCPEGKSGCMTRLQSVGHSEATARGACWRCTTPCQTAFVLVDPTVTVPVDVPPSTPPEPLAPSPSTPTISCPEGKVACIARLTPLHGAATARGACWRCL